MNRLSRHLIFFTGLASVAWVGAGYLGGPPNPLALAITAFIGAFYLLGGLELRRFQHATDALARALAELPAALPALHPWLEQVPAALRHATRRRIEGEPAAFAGPALAPALAGLLVLLGMLGTFVGMVFTLRGTGMALESATDLQAVRTSLVAPVAGLGLAFGTSVAGVAASAALGLLTALCRRARAQAAQQLDARIAGTLRPFSMAHQREESLKLQHRQAELIPALVDRLQAMTAAMERQAQASSERLQADQARFHGQAEAAYTGLAASVERTLQACVTQSAHVAGETLRPVVEATLGGIGRETAALQAALAGTAQRQLDQLSANFEHAAERVADTWQTALARHEHAGQGQAKDLRASLDRFAETFEQRSAALLAQVGDRQAKWQGEMASAAASLARETAAVQERIAQAATAQLEGVSTRLDGAARQLTDHWRDTLAQHEQLSAQAAGETRESLVATSAAFGQQADALLRTVKQAHADLQSASATQDQQHLAALTQSLESMAAALQREWQHAGAQTLAQQERLCETLADTAHRVTAQAEAHITGTSAEIARLLEAAAQAPRAAAEVISDLRDKLSDSMARDNALLEERGRILDTLSTLLQAVNHAATEQRGAIDALVASSADLLDRVGNRFHAQVEAQAGKLSDVAAQVTGGAVEVASLGEAFGFAVQLFSQSNEQLMAQLQRIEGALSASLSRSDEQLAYYVAQAREVVDLSVLSQKQIIDDLQRLSGKGAA
jgi:hypothetical protein